MNARQLIVMGMAALLLVGGVAATGAALPAESANESAANAVAGNAPDDVPAANQPDDRVAAGDDRAAGSAHGIGPSDGLPGQAADHASEVHATIEAFLTQTNEHVGESLSELLAGSIAGGAAS